MVSIQKSRWNPKRKISYPSSAILMAIIASTGIKVMMLWVHWIWSHTIEELAISRSTSQLESYSRTNEEDDYENEEDAFLYAKRFRQLDRKLVFFHIPKTAGTAIEFAAGSRKIPWGSCLFSHRPKRTICKYPQGEDWPRNIGWWHLPRFLFPLADTDPYQNTDLFGVIRNPYDRMVSEFYYICTLQAFDWRPSQCDTTKLFDQEYMNEWIRSKLDDREQDSGLAYLMDNGHFTAQYDFIFGPHQVRMLDYVLRMDDSEFTTNFQRLMDDFGLSEIRLKKINAIGAAKRDSETHLQVRHLSNTTRYWIREAYEKDFMFGGYQGLVEQIS